MPALSFADNSVLSPSDDARLSRIETALPVSRFGSVTISKSSLSVPSSNAVLATGQISPVSGVANTGNTFSFVVQGQFGFAWSGSTLTIYWDGTNGSTPFVIRRADQSQVSIPRGSLAIAGLTSSTQIAFYPYVSVAQPERISFVAGDIGSPRFGFSPAVPAAQQSLASQTQRLSQNERITDGPIYFTTGASGNQTSGGGTGSGGLNPYPGQDSAS